MFFKDILTLKLITVLTVVRNSFVSYVGHTKAFPFFSGYIVTNTNLNSVCYYSFSCHLTTTSTLREKSPSTKLFPVHIFLYLE